MSRREMADARLWHHCILLGFDSVVPGRQPPRSMQPKLEPVRLPSIARPPGVTDEYLERHKLKGVYR